MPPTSAPSALWAMWMCTTSPGLALSAMVTIRPLSASRHVGDRSIAHIGSHRNDAAARKVPEDAWPDRDPLHPRLRPNPYVARIVALWRATSRDRTHKPRSIPKASRTATWDRSVVRKSWKSCGASAVRPAKIIVTKAKFHLQMPRESEMSKPGQRAGNRRHPQSAHGFRATSQRPAVDRSDLHELLSRQVISPGCRE